MKRLTCLSIVLAAGVAFAAPALAQPGPDGGPAVVASQPVPDTAHPSQGIPGPEAVNPAPGAQGPYVGAGKQGFYDVDQRIASVSQQIGSLPLAQRRRAMAKLKAIKSEEAFKRAKYGELRDWDREHLTVMLDQMAQAFPQLGDAGPMAPPPAQ